VATVTNHRDPKAELRQMVADKLLARWVDEAYKDNAVDLPVDGQCDRIAGWVVELLGGALLTEAEHRAMGFTVDLWHALCRIADDGPAREGDLAELCAHIHAIQRTILAQAAGRAYPDRYRLLGGHPPTGPARLPEPTGFITTT
jgi:hypothetical protein